jgi:hypothetical protein
VRINKSRQGHASAQIQFLRRARFRQGFHLRPRPHCHYQPAAYKQSAILDQAQI